jgi:hypothetical protein
MVPDRLWYCTVLYRLCYLGLSIFMYRPGQLSGRATLISGELQAGGNRKCLCLTGVVLMTLQKTTLDSVSAVTLGIYLCDAPSHSTGKALAKMAPSYILTRWGV